MLVSDELLVQVGWQEDVEIVGRKASGLCW